MNITDSLFSFLLGSGTSLATIMSFIYLRRQEKRDKVFQLNQVIHQEMTRLQLLINKLETDREKFRELYYSCREKDLK